MSDQTRVGMNLPQLTDECLFRIFTRTDPKTAARCRTLNNIWRCRLTTPTFIKRNFKHNKENNVNVIVGVGHPPTSDYSFLLARVDMDTRVQFESSVPSDISHYGRFSVIGSSNGILCIKYDMFGVTSGIVIWNPLDRKRSFATDESKKHKNFAVSLYAFGHAVDTLDYAILHVFKESFDRNTLFWSLFSTKARNWNCTGSFECSAHKLGPTYVVHKGVVYWIGWEGVALPRPKSIITFNLMTKLFAEEEIPKKVKYTFHTLTLINGSVGLISSYTSSFKTLVSVFEVTKNGPPAFSWERICWIPNIGLPFSPITFSGKFLITALDSRSGQSSGNDAERTDLLVSKHDYRGATSHHLLHRTWREAVSLQTVTLHSHSIFPVE